MLRTTPNKSQYDNLRPAPDAHAWYEFGRAAIERGDLEEGRQALLQSLAGSQPIVEQVLAVAHQLGSIGFEADAAQILRRAMELFPDRAEPSVSLAWLFLEGGDPHAGGRGRRSCLARAPRQHRSALHRVGGPRATGGADRGRESPELDPDDRSGSPGSKPSLGGAAPTSRRRRGQRALLATRGRGDGDAIWMR